MRVTALIVVLGGAVAAAQSPRADHLLDILASRVTPQIAVPANSGRLPAGAVSGTEGDQHRESRRLKVTLLSLDRVDYETGDSVIYELLIENIGNSPVVLPWSPDHTLFTAGSVPAPLARAAIFLEVLDHAGSKQIAWLEPSVLFGSEAVSGSLETLLPGETAWMRVPGFWRTSEREMRAVLSETNGDVKLAAVFDILQAPLRVRSTNRIDVVVRIGRLP